MIQFALDKKSQFSLDTETDSPSTPKKLILCKLHK